MQFENTVKLQTKYSLYFYLTGVRQIDVMWTQSLKLQLGNSLIVMKFGHSLTEENWDRVTIYPNSHIFETSAFEYDSQVVDMFLKPQKISIVDIKQSPKGRRLSLEGIVIEKSSISGSDWIRTDVLLSSREDDSQKIWVKFWNLFCYVHTP